VRGKPSLYGVAAESASGINVGISGQVQPALHHGLVSTLQKLHVFKRVMLLRPCVGHVCVMLMGGASQKLSSVLGAELEIGWPQPIGRYMGVYNYGGHADLKTHYFSSYFSVGGHFPSLSIVIQFYFLVTMAYTKAKLARLR
jgi:hypothetical protein